jgi:hypothetical protein
MDLYDVRARISCCFTVPRRRKENKVNGSRRHADGKLTNWKFRMPTGKEMAGFSLITTRTNEVRCCQGFRKETRKGFDHRRQN